MTEENQGSYPAIDNFACESFSISLDGHVAHLTLNCPQKANCLTVSFFEKLPRAIQLLAQSGARVMIVTAEGGNFSSGIDLALLGDPDAFRKHKHSRALSFIDVVKKFQAAITCLETAPFPVLAGVDGYCLGAALDLIAACDVRYATEGSSYAIAEINVGMMADLGSLQRLPSKMHEGLVRQMAFSGRPINGKQAFDSGLVTSIYPDADSMITGLRQLADEIASKEPRAVRATKRSLNYNRGHTLTQSLSECARLQLMSIDLNTVRNNVAKIIASLRKKR